MVGVLVALVLFLAGSGLILYAVYELRRLAAQGDEAGLPPEVRRLRQLLEDLLTGAEDLAGDLEDRAARLAELVAAADARLEALRAALAAPPAPANPPAPAAAPGAPVAAPVPTAAPAPPGAETAPPVPGPAATPAQSPVSAGPGVPGAEGDGDGASLRLPPLHREVFRLADAGLDADAIARELQVPRGEVRLILGLRRLH